MLVLPEFSNSITLFRFSWRRLYSIKPTSNQKASYDSSVQTGDNGIVTPDMPSPLDFRTVASLTVSSKTGRLTYQYALTTTPCTKALFTATGGPNAFYAELGFPLCKLVLDAKHDYEEAIL